MLGASCAFATEGPSFYGQADGTTRRTISTVDIWRILVDIVLALNLFGGHQLMICDVFGGYLQFSNASALSFQAKAISCLPYLI
jgi:hypothetical protein